VKMNLICWLFRMFIGYNWKRISTKSFTLHSQYTPRSCWIHHSSHELFVA
jgi:hypothetical protein